MDDLSIVLLQQQEKAPSRFYVIRCRKKARNFLCVKVEMGAFAILVPLLYKRGTLGDLGNIQSPKERYITPVFQFDVFASLTTF